MSIVSCSCSLDLGHEEYLGMFRLEQRRDTNHNMSFGLSNLDGKKAASRGRDMSLKWHVVATTLPFWKPWRWGLSWGWCWKDLPLPIKLVEDGFVSIAQPTPA